MIIPDLNLDDSYSGARRDHNSTKELENGGPITSPAAVLRDIADGCARFATALNQSLYLLDFVMNSNRQELPA
jgi:hypothetical protein